MSSPEPPNRTSLVSVPVLARRLGVPAYWIRREAKAGRIPAIPAGAAFLFDYAAVEHVLLQRAASRGMVPQDGEHCEEEAP